MTNVVSLAMYFGMFGSIFFLSQFLQTVLHNTPLQAGIKLLRAGASRYAYDILKDAGVDLAKPAPFDAAMREMNGVMDRIEAILAKREAAR